ncbi:MAG: type II toxin-antitoxin system RelE/ParE family toxin [Actinobacteria bacterium]|nr:type II toxin-antitoxin system RelE/ParE family toxin [Actinomycetota bacterium]
MRIDFAKSNLGRLYEDVKYRPKKYSPELVKAFRKKVALLQAVQDERELREHKALRLEKLHSDLAGHHSIRLNDQWRLIIRFAKDDQGKLVLIIEILDYH